MASVLPPTPPYRAQAETPYNVTTDEIPTTTTTTKLSTQTPTIPAIIPPHPLALRYSRQLLLPQLHGLTGQTNLSNSRVLIIGLGGLGCPAALYLATSGIGTLGFVDDDVVELSNLHRQVLHTEARVGWAKVDSAAEGVKAVNSGCKVRRYKERVDARRLLEVLDEEWEWRKGWDLVLDCSDNVGTRYGVSDAAVVVGVPVVWGAGQMGEGMVMVLGFRYDLDRQGEEEEGRVGRGPCYRCVFPRPPDPELVKGCGETGVLGTVVGTIGVLMAQEAVKLLVGGGKRMGLEREGKGEMLLVNAFGGLKGMFRGVGLRGRREGCLVCGDAEVVRRSGGQMITRERLERDEVDYEAFCGSREVVKVLGMEERVDARDFMEDLSRGGRRVVDVREDIEVELGSKLEGVIHIPFSKILADPDGVFSGEEWMDDLSDEKMDAYTNGLPQTDNTNRQPQLNGHASASERNGEPPTTTDSSARGGQGSFTFICHQGNDSQLAARCLTDVDTKLGRKRRGWVGDVEGGFVALERLAQKAPP